MKFLSVLAVGLVVAAGLSRADQQADAKAILNKAIKAIGSEAKLANLSTASVKAKITASEGGQEITINVDGIWQRLTQYRLDVDVQQGGQNIKGVLVVNGDKGWFKAMCKTDDAPDGVVPFVHNVFYAMRMPQLLSALTSKDYTLSHLGEVKIGNQVAVGVSISHKDRKDVSLFFDKDNGLPIKSEIRLTHPKGDKEITVEYHYSDYKDFDGVKLCGKIQIKGDDKEFTLELSEIKPMDKVDEAQFGKP
jgi:hypothetical protein